MLKDVEDRFAAIMSNADLYGTYTVATMLDPRFKAQSLEEDDVISGKQEILAKSQASYCN